MKNEMKENSARVIIKAYVKEIVCYCEVDESQYHVGEGGAAPVIPFPDRLRFTS